MNKNIYLKQHENELGFNINMCYLKLQSHFLNTQPVLLMAFPPTITTPNIWENTTFNHTPVAAQCTLIAADWNSTAYYLPKNRQDL